MQHSNNRIYILDLLRGIAVIGMVIHHSLVSYEIFFSQRVEFLYTDLFYTLQLIFVSVFLLVSGICTNYSRNTLKRGSIVFMAALLVSFVTCVVLPAFDMHGLNIYFGILHMFGLSMILYALFKKMFDKIHTMLGVILFALLFIAYYLFYITEPTSNSYLLMIFGVLPNNVVSYGDYYPLLPYFFLFISGTYIGKYIKNGRFPDWFYDLRCKPLECVGRYSLWIYILHQPVVFLLFNIITI